MSMVEGRLLEMYGMNLNRNIIMVEERLFEIADANSINRNISMFEGRLLEISECELKK